MTEQICFRCHALAAWYFTFAASKKTEQTFSDATRLPRGTSRSQLTKRQNKSVSDATRLPRGVSGLQLVATNVNLHGARPWHPSRFCLVVAANVKYHAASAWHLKTIRS